MEPVITFALFTSIATMEHAVDSLRVHCVDGITANVEHSRDMVLNSLGIVTVLKPSARLQAVRGDRARGLRDRQVAARDRRRGDASC
jgi:aspartate ammonia-lyase